MSAENERSARTSIAGTPPAGTRSVEGKIEIEASPEVVWRALTDAAELARWFPLEARVDPGVGGEIYLSWRNEYAGSSEILVWEPGRHLRTRWGGVDGMEQVQLTDYTLEGKGGRTVLRVVTSGFPADPSWDAWVEGTRQGWRYELASLKHYLERHPGEEREVVYLRRRVVIPPEEAWRRLAGKNGLGSRPLGGRAFIDDPPRQYAAIVADPPDALLRISTEPCFGKEGDSDVTLWLAAYGDQGGRLDAIREDWDRRLARLYLEGEKV